MPMLKKLEQIKEILDHPSNRENKISAFLTYLKWNIGRRLLNQANYAIKLTQNAEVILSNNENYATLAYTCGLYDYDEMCFLSDFIRPGDTFGDFGANVGVYSVLAGSYGASVISIEPVPETFSRLQQNLLLNNVKGNSIQCCLSDTEGETSITSDLGGLNHITNSNLSNSIKVPMHTANKLLSDLNVTPDLLKIDVEGFELPLLKGCSNFINDVKAVIIELNGSGNRYGYSDGDVYDYLLNSGFSCFNYCPDSKNLTIRDSFQTSGMNSLFINNNKIDEIRSRLDS